MPFQAIFIGVCIGFGRHDACLSLTVTAQVVIKGKHLFICLVFLKRLKEAFYFILQCKARCTDFSNVFLNPAICQKEVGL